MKRKKSRRPKLPPVSEEMRAWCAALAGELSTWPDIRRRSFFGFTALYRENSIFALLPGTRGMETANSLAFKIDHPSPSVGVRLRRDRRIGSTEMQKVRWFRFELSSDGDLHEALDWLGRAYEAAGNSNKRR